MNKWKKKNSYPFLQDNDCKTPYIDIYIDLLSINFNLQSVLYSPWAGTWKKGYLAPAGGENLIWIFKY